MDQENPRGSCGATCAILAAHHKKICLFLAIAVLVVGLAFPLMHIAILWTCGLNAARTRSPTCVDAEALSFGRGIIVPSTLVIGEVAAAVIVGVRCIRGV
jgi:hypothetical protein